MAKKYSSLQSLAKGSSTPYGKSDPTSKTNNPTTFNVPYLRNTSPTYTERDGKSISNYVPASALKASVGATCSPKHTLITGGEYSQGSFAIGAQAADSFRQNEKFPSAIYVTKYVSDGQMNIDLTYQSVTSVQDLGGTYTDASGTTQIYNITPTILTGADVSYMGADSEPIVLVYHGVDLAPYAGIREIRVTYSDTTTKDFEVIIPGWKNNSGFGQSIVQSPLYAGGSSGNGNTVYSCDDTASAVISGSSKSWVHSHRGVNINNSANPVFVGNGGGANDNGVFNLNVTRLGTHHDNTGLWSEGFQPDDNLTGGSSFMTNAHQETWPLGLFYSQINDETEMLMFHSTSSLVTYSVKNMWETQYAGSELTNSFHPSVKRGSPLAADSEQHYELIQGFLLNKAQAASGRGWNTQVESSQFFNSAGITPNNSGTNTADDGGFWFNQIQVEMMSAVGSVWNNSSLGYTTHEGGEFKGFIGEPDNMASSPVFQHIQIYSKDLSCSCFGAPPGGPIQIDLCNDPNSLNYWQFVGTDCSGTAIPSDLWNGTATLGNFGCTSCDYELFQTSCITGCDCQKLNESPVISATSSPPTALGGNDGVLNINVATGGEGAFVYFIEPLANTSAGLGVGAVDNYTQTAVGGSALTSNGLWVYKYLSGGSGVDLVVELDVQTYLTPIFTLNRFIQRGKDYVSGDSIILINGPTGSTITVTIGTVTGLVVSPYSLNNGKRHYEFTDAACVVTAVELGRKVTLGTNVFLEQEQAVGINNYGSYGSSLGAGTNLAQFPPQVEPYKYPDLFNSYSFTDSNGNNYPITGLEAGDYKITVFESNYPCANGSITESTGCFSQKTITIGPGASSPNGCTDSSSGTNDGVALNYDATAQNDDDSCIYCRATDGKLVDYTSTELSVAGSANPGDILTSTNTSIALGATDSVTADGSISYSRSLNSIMNYYAGLITNVNGTSNAEFKMELYSRSSSVQTLTGASLVGAPVVNTNIQGFNKDFDSASWSQGLTYGYYAIKSYVNDPDSASEQEDCFQVDYFIVPVLACIVGQAGMQVGITTDNVTITDLDLVVASITGNNLDPCTLQCCDAPALTSYIVQTSPSCSTPAFNITQSCPNGVEQYITNTLHDVEFSSDNGVTWSSVWSNPVANSLNHSYTINIYNAYGPGDYRVTVTRTFTWANGTTSQCIDSSNSVLLETDICGCTDPTALNFDPLAVIDDGSCTYCVDGCMDPTAINYNSLATCDDGSCMGCVYGCMDPAANNYNAFATCDDGSCNYGVGCGCTNILASNFGYDCDGNAVGFPPTCDDGCCEGLCANPPDITTPIITTEATCGCPQTAGCNSSLVGTSGGPGYFILNLDFGTDKGVAVITFNTGHSNLVTAPLTNSIPDIMRLEFDGNTTSEYSSLVGGYLTGLIGTPDDGISSTWPCPGCDQSGYLTQPKNISVFEFNQSTQNFQSTFNTQAVGPYGANSTGDVTLSKWSVAGNSIPNIGQTPNYRTTFNQDGHFNRNSVSYISVPTSTTASTAKVLIEAPCPSTWWGVTLSCPDVLTGMGGSVSAPYGSNNATVTALSITTEYFHIPIDRAGGTNPNSSYWNGTGSGVGQQSGTLGKHDWIFTDAYGENRLAAGNYKIESPAASGVFWNVTVGVPTYVDDVNINTAPAGPVEGGVVLMMEGPL